MKHIVIIIFDKDVIYCLVENKFMHNIICSVSSTFLVYY